MDEERKAIQALEAPLQELGYRLVEVHYGKGKESSLQVVVDRVEPISLDDIVMLSEKISALLDEADPIEEAYSLDISSLGAEKPIAIEELEKYVGRYVNLHLSHPYRGENILEGTLEEATEDKVLLQIREKTKKVTAELPRKDVDRARLAIQF